MQFVSSWLENVVVIQVFQLPVSGQNEVFWLVKLLTQMLHRFTKDDTLSMDFNAYLASSGSSDEIEGEDGDNAIPGEGSGGTAEENQIQKYRVCVNTRSTCRESAPKLVLFAWPPVCSNLQGSIWNWGQTGSEACFCYCYIDV